MDTIDQFKVGTRGHEARHNSVFPAVFGGGDDDGARQAGVDTVEKTAGELGGEGIGEEGFPDAFTTADQAERAEGDAIFPEPVDGTNLDGGGVSEGDESGGHDGAVFVTVDAAHDSRGC